MARIAFPLLLAALGPALMLAGCGGGNVVENLVNNRDGNVAFPDVGQSPVPDTVTADASANAAVDTGADTGADGTTAAPDDNGPNGDGPGADAAVDVLRRYFDHIAARRYRQAWLLWGHGGQASGKTARDFAAGFARYSTYRATLGTPGEIDAGAGQRYIAIPVTVEAVARNGVAERLSGTITLHRTGAIPGATEEQRNWRLYAADLSPDAAPAGEVADNRSTARYACADGAVLVAEYDPDNRRVTIRHGGERPVALTQQRVESGLRYTGNGHVLRVRGDRAVFTAPGVDPVACRAQP